LAGYYAHVKSPIKQYLGGEHRPLELMRLAGFFTWVCATIPLLLYSVIYPDPLPVLQLVTWITLHVVFGLTYWRQVNALPVTLDFRFRLLVMAVLSLCGLGITLMSESGLGGIHLLIVSGLLPWMMRPLPAIIWMMAQFILLAIAFRGIPNVEFGDAAYIAGLFFGISLFTAMGSLVALRQHRARDELRKVNSELKATQALLAENTRIAERVRISRELHDLVGHHLTALTLNLQVATHLVEGKALEHVEQAHSLSRLLLADVREVVSELRRDDKVDIAEALQTLVQGVPEPRIHLDLQSGLALTEPSRAQVLLRCAQEMISNTVRHAAARNLWIKLVMDEKGVSLTARDDGRGVDQLEAGNGLNGMSERLKQIGGKLDVDSSPGNGFSLHAWVPIEVMT
jgi:signal transduction histidine kinase